MTSEADIVADTVPTVSITINGQKIPAGAGQTVLEAAESVGIDIPTLCHHPALEPYGACRMCLVEIVGQRSMQPACTFKIAEGMEIQTESPSVVKARRSILQLLFSERNHFCMFCEMSGSCELQDLAYRYGLEKWIYHRTYPKLKVDASHPYLLHDPNRCILCRRCVRVCAELAGNHTLGVRNRGAESVIDVDLNVPLGESTCISCGACAQVCPTGALVDRRSAYLEADPDEVDRVDSTCTFCSVGCGTQLVTSYNHLIRIDADWERAPSNGLLCPRGRYEPLTERRARIRAPMIRQEGELQEVEWQDALRLVADSIRRLGGRWTGLSSPRLTNEALSLFVRLFRDGLGADIGSLATVPRFLFDPEDGLDVLEQADTIAVVGADLTVDHQVVGFLVRRAVTNRGARLILVDGESNGLAHHADAVFTPGEIARAIELCTSASLPVVVYGALAGSDLDQLRKALAGRARFVGLVPGTNCRGAIAAGVNGSAGSGAASAYYVLSGNDRIDEDVLQRLEVADFVVVHSSYLCPLTRHADVVLPTTLWSEQSGHITNTEGRILEVKAALQPPAGVRSDEDILRALAADLEVEL
jgi:formate dehydrogenase major subunit